MPFQTDKAKQWCETIKGLTYLHVPDHWRLRLLTLSLYAVGISRVLPLSPDVPGPGGRGGGTGACKHALAIKHMFWEEIIV